MNIKSYIIECIINGKFLSFAYSSFRNFVLCKPCSDYNEPIGKKNYPIRYSCLDLPPSISIKNHSNITNSVIYCRLK